MPLRCRPIAKRAAFCEARRPVKPFKRFSRTGNQGVEPQPEAKLRAGAEHLVPADAATNLPAALEEFPLPGSDRENPLP